MAAWEAVGDRRIDHMPNRHHSTQQHHHHPTQQYVVVVNPRMHEGKQRKGQGTRLESLAIEGAAACMASCPPISRGSHTTQTHQALPTTLPSPRRCQRAPRPAARTPTSKSLRSQNPASHLSPPLPPHTHALPPPPQRRPHSPNPPVDEEQKQLEEQQKAAREQQIAILQQFVDSGGKDRLKAVLRERLQEVGWKEGVKELCKEVMRNNRIEGVTVDELVASTTARARGALEGGKEGGGGRERKGGDVEVEGGWHA